MKKYVYQVSIGAERFNIVSSSLLLAVSAARGLWTGEKDDSDTNLKSVVRAELIDAVTE